MDDLISRAAAIDYLMTNMGWRDEDGYEVDDADEKRAIITNLVNGIPAVDAVLVVRCMHCKHWWEVNELCTHPRHVHGTVCVHECNATDYCSDGERRDGA